MNMPACSDTSTAANNVCLGKCKRQATSNNKEVTTPFLNSNLNEKVTDALTILEEQCRSEDKVKEMKDGLFQAGMNIGLAGLAAIAAHQLDGGDDDEKPTVAEENVSLDGLDQGNTGFNSLNPAGSFAGQDTKDALLPDGPSGDSASDDVTDDGSSDPSGAGSLNPAGSRGRNPSPISGGGAPSLPNTGGGAGGKKAKTQASGSSIGYGVGSGLSGSSSASGSFSGSGYQARVENSYLKRKSKKVARTSKNKAGFIKRTVALNSKKGRSIFDKASKIIKNYCSKEISCK